MTSVIIWLIFDYLMIIWWLFVDYLLIIWSLFALLWLFVILKCDCERLTRFRICQAMLPHNTGGQACTSGKGYLQVWFAWFLTARASPVNFDVGGEHSTNARMRTRSYNLCIWNSRIVLSACFGFDLFDGASATSANATHQIEQAGSHSRRLL